AGEERDAEEPGPRTAAERATDRDGSAPLFRFDREETRRDRLAASAERAAGPWPLAGRLWAESRDSERLRTLLIAAGLGDRALRSVEGDTLGAALEGSRVLAVPLGEAVLRGGAEGTHEELAGSYRGVGEGGAAGPVVATLDGRRRRAAAFLTGDWTVPLAADLRLRLVGGTRWDRIDDRVATAGTAPGPADADDAVQDAWSPRLGANLLLDRPGRPPLALWLRAARAFKAPTLEQLFDPRPLPDFAGGTITLANPDLSPQRAADLELGARGATTAGPLLWEIAAYRTEVDDEIDFDPATFRYANIGATRHEGFEAEARLGRPDRLATTAAWTWQRVVPREGANAGRQLKNIPEHSARLTTTAALPADLALTATLSWLGNRWLDDAHRFPLGEATVIDLRLVAQRPWGELRLDLLNVAGEEHDELGLALPDFTGGEVPYCFPAPGRAAKLELAWDF
ncbi:MAG TPA: TonB-dependent receptor, partial [Thermoanaerobaculia bacterium]|nr:TonB-dependent receptor [Thermoanaerobaculia bacterium]